MTKKRLNKLFIENNSLFVLAEITVIAFLILTFGDNIGAYLALHDVNNGMIYGGIISRVLSLIYLIIVSRIYGLNEYIKLGFKSFFTGIILASFVFSIPVARVIIIFFDNIKAGFGIDKRLLLGYIGLYLSVGMLEEFWFRGIFLNALKAVYGRNKLFIIIGTQAVAFGTLHILNYRTCFFSSMYECFTQVYIAICIGVILGLIYEVTESLAACICVHAMWDFSLSCHEVFIAKEPIIMFPVKLYHLALALTMILLFIILVIAFLKVNVKIEKEIEDIDEIET